MPPIQDCVLRCRIRVRHAQQIFWDRHDVILRGRFAEIVLEWHVFPRSSEQIRTPKAVVRIPLDEFLPVPDPTADYELVSAAILDLDGATCQLVEHVHAGRFCPAVA